MHLTPKKYETCFSAIGNVLTWYCYALFMAFFAILSKVFFPEKQSSFIVGLSFFIFSLGLFSRPFGAAVFGPIGDRIGRHKAISFSIIVMAIPTICVAFLPTYKTIGLVSILLLILFRTLQGVSMGGEYTAALVHMVEQAPKHRRGFYGSFADIGNQLGVLIANQSLLFLYVFFTEKEIYDYAWRFPFLGALLLIPLAFFVPKSNAVKQKSVKTPFKQMLMCHKTTVLYTIFITAFSAVSFYTLTVFIPFYFKTKNLLTLKQITQANIISTIIMICAIFIGGYFSDKFKRRNFMLFGIIGVLLVTYILFFIGKYTFTLYVIMISFYSIFLGIYYSSRSAFFAESFPSEVRCTAVSFSLSISQAIFGGLTPWITDCLSCLHEHCIVIPLTIVTITAIYSLFQIKDRTGEDLI